MLPYRFTGKELDRETGLYYYGARYLNPKSSRWVSGDPAGWELINPMGKEGSLRSGFNIIEATNWYSYVSNNPVRYVDPTGMKLMDVPNDTNQGNSSANLGLGKSTIADAGCVLEATVRIARAISGSDKITLESANNKANELELFSGKGKNELSTDGVASLISALTGEDIGYGSITGTEQGIIDGLSALSRSDNEYYATGRIDTYSKKNSSKRYGHTVNITRGLTQYDYHMGVGQQPVVDTSPRNRSYLEHGLGSRGPGERLLRADYFFVK